MLDEQEIELLAEAYYPRDSEAAQYIAEIIAREFSHEDTYADVACPTILRYIEKGHQGFVPSRTN